jgi:hypothetical protein
LNPDKDFWGDGKTALQRAAERCDAYASFALLESERDGTDAGLERFLKRLEEVRLPNEDAE